MYEMNFDDFDAITNEWLFNPDSREIIERRFAAIGIIAQAKKLPLTGCVYLDVTIPDNVFIAAPEEDEDNQS